MPCQAVVSERATKSVIVLRLGLPLLLLSILPGAGLPSNAWGQVNLRGRGDDQSLDQILLAPRPLTRLLREGKAAIEEKRYSDGISALGALLLEEERDDLPEDALRQDFFTEQGGEGYYRSSVRGEALRLLGSIPAEGRKTLEIQYGVAATRALDAAVAAADIEAISEVTRKYYHTNAGYDASVLLAQDKLIRGFPVAAASILQRLSEFPAARERFGAQLIGELASAWALARRLDLAAQALDQGAKLFPAASIVLGNRPTQLEPSQAWNRLLTEAFPEQSHIDQRFLADWLMTGGEAARNGTVNAGLPLPTLSWDMTLHRDRGDEEAVDNMAMRDGQSGSVLLPKLEARMTGNIVLAKTAAANIFAIDLDTGLRLWPFYKHLAPIELAPRATNMLPGELDELLAGADLRNRIWGSSAFGQFACDTNHLYYISSPDDQQFHQPQFFNPFARASSVTSYNYLTGVSLQDEGKVVWHIGGPDGESEPKLAGAYFLGPPLSFEGELYTLVEINGETRLAVLDAASGRLQWSQQLTQSPMSPIGRDRARQSQALSPSISDSIAVCPVGNGAIIAVDLLTRSLLWGKQYPTNTRDRNQLQMLNGLNDGMDAYEPTEERWQEPEVLIHKGQIVFTPPESNTIMCIDLLTGIPRWQQRRGMARYVAGIHNDRIVLVANTEVFALNLSDGRPSWGADITLSANAPSGSQTAGSPPTSKTRATMASRDRETVAGKSVRDGKNLYVPTSSRRVLKIDLDQGKLVDAASVEQPLGNLFAFRNRLISVSATRITAYYIRDALAEEVKQRLVANAQDTWALNQQALIHLADNQVKEAINLLRQSYAINATDGDTRFLLGSALLAGLEQDFDGYMALASELEPIIESQHFRFLVLLIKGNLRSGQYEIAFNRLLELMRERLRTKQPSLQTRGESVVLSAEHEVDVDSWIASQLGIAYERATPEAQQRMQALIAQRMQAITKSHPLTREMELQYLAWIPVAQPALLALADSLLGNTDQALGERLMQSILFSPDESLRRQAQTALARNSQFEDLAALSFLANDQFMLADDRPATMATQPLETQRAVLWPRGKVEETKLSKDAAFLHGQIRLKQVSNRYGRPNIEVGLASDGVTISNDSGQVLSRCEFERGAAEGADHFLRCQVDGGLVLLETQTELVAFDINRSRQAANDAILWRYSLSRAPQGPQTPFSAATHVPLNSPLGFQTFSRGSNLREAVVGPITPSGVLIQKESDLIMLNALSGAKLWRRTGYDDRTTLVRNGLEIAVMRPSVGKIDILDCRDGQLLKQLEYQGDWTTWFVSQAHVIQYAKLEAKQASGIQTEANSGSILRILNAFSGEVLLTKEFAPGCRADACSDRYIAVLDPKGQLWFCDAQSTKTAEHTTPVQAKLDRVRLQQFGQTLVLMTGTPLTRTGNVQVTTAADENAQTKGLYPINGHVFALSLAEGSLLWDRPATLSGFTFPSSQPRSAPFMACYRVIRNDRSHTAHVVLIDLRDGTPVYFNTNLPLKSSECEFAMELNPSRLAVQLSINAFQINLSMTDGDKPPQPVSYFGPISAQRSKPPVGKEFDLFNPAR